MNSSNVCSLHRREGRGQSRGSKPGRYWLFLCSVWLAGVSEGVSPREALDSKSNHLDWCSPSWALRSKVCWVWLRRSPCLPSGFSPDDGGITLTSNPGRGTARAPLESWTNQDTAKGASLMGALQSNASKSDIKLKHMHTAGDELRIFPSHPPIPPPPPLFFVCIIRELSSNSH